MKNIILIIMFNVMFIILKDLLLHIVHSLLYLLKTYFIFLIFPQLY